MKINPLQPMANKEESTPRADNRNPDVLRAARMYENQFLREMVKAMRQAVPESEFLPASMGEKIFREQLDDQYVETWTDIGGVGLADHIYDQVFERYMGSRPANRPQGPIPLGKAQAGPVALKPGDMTLKIQTKTQPEIPDSFNVTAPWSGQVLSSQDLGGGFKSLLLDHGDLKSALVFKGSLLASEGRQVQSGQRLGLLSADNQELLWRLQR